MRCRSWCGAAYPAVRAAMVVVALVAAALPLLVGAASPAAAATGDVSLVAAQLAPFDLAAGGDGNLWFTDQVTDSIVRMTTGGTMTTFKPAGVGRPRDLTWGPDGRVWFIDRDAETIGALDPVTSAVATYTPELSPFGPPIAMLDLVASAGDLWFLTESLVVRMHPDGTTAGYAVPSHAGRSGRPRALVAGPDGNVWFTFDGALLHPDTYGNASIGRLTPAGVQTVFDTPPQIGGQPGIAVSAAGDAWTTGPMYHRAPGEDVASRVGPDFATFVDGLSVILAPDGNVWTSGASTDSITRVATDETVLAPLPVPSQGPLDAPTHLTLGPDGNVWYLHGTKVGRITTAGAVTLFGPNDLDQPGALTNGPDGDVWVVNRGHGFGPGVPTSISRVTPAGAVTTFTDPQLGALEDLTTGADGNVWFTDRTKVQIGRMTPAGVVTTYPAGYVPKAITLGPDGNVWFTSAGHVSRVTPAGVITTFTTDDPGHFGPRSIVTGPDGNLWMTAGYAIARVTPAGAITTFDTAEPTGEDIAVGPDGKLWFPYGDTSLGAMTTSGLLTTAPVGAAKPLALAAGADGAMWALSTSGAPIVRYVPGGALQSYAAPPIGPHGSIVARPDGELWYTDGSSVRRIEPGPAPVTGATVSITPSVNPSDRRQEVTFTIDVDLEPASAGLAIGTVSIADGATTIGTVPVVSGHATFTTSLLRVGSHQVTATFDPPDIDPVTSPAATQVVHAVPHADGRCVANSTGVFADVPWNHPFCIEIGWVVEHGIATGYSLTSFRPATTVSRQAMASFLWKAAGSPASGLASPFFADVPPSHPFYAAIQWLAATGLSTGSAAPGGGPPLFKPTDGVSRQAAAAFLWRQAGAPAPAGSTAPFVDVPAGHPFAPAIWWAAEVGITTGTPAPPGLPQFRPTAPVSRQSMAAFLWRDDQRPAG